MANSYPPWDAYRVLKACRLIALDKRLGLCPVGIGEMLRRDITKLIMRATEDQAKPVCGSLQLCAVIESGIEGATYTMVQRCRKRRKS